MASGSTSGSVSGSEVNVTVKNCLNCAVISKVSLTHHYKNEEPKSKTWDQLQLEPGELTSSFNLGSFDEGKSTWDVSADVLITGTTTATLSNSTRQFSAPLHSSDAGKDITIEISENSVKIIKASGDKVDKLRIEVNSNPTRPEPVAYSYMAYVTVHNKFPIPINAALSHQYGSNTIIRKVMDTIPPDSVTAPWPVFFNSTMLKSDYWNVQVTFNMADSYPPPIWKNATADIKAALLLADEGKIVECTLDGRDGVKLQLATTSSKSEFTSPHGFSRTAFGTIKNNFKVPVRMILLKHSYNKQKACYVRYNVSPGATTEPFTIEYYTGATSPYHLWNVVVELEDGTRYVNCDKDQKLYFKSVDANVMHIFGVSDSTFLVRLVSENSNFETNMTFVQIAPCGQGRDSTLPYNSNAFLLSHNSHTSLENGFGAKVATQSYNLHAQLAEGATALQLEIYDANDDVAVSNHSSQQNLLSDELCYVKDFMKHNPSEVVTIFLKDHLDKQRDRIQNAFEKADLWDKVFFCDRETANWTVSSQGWPTLKWMVENKKNLVVFTTSKDGPFPHVWSHVSESVHGEESVDTSKWVCKRYESADLTTRPLMLLNHFPTVPAAGKNASVFIQKHVNDIQKHWVQLPNFLALDFFEQPEAGPELAIVALNRKMQQHITN